MSHIVTIATEVRDAAAVRAACARLKLPAPVDGSHELFISTVQGLAIQLPNWAYPVVCHLDTAKVEYDNFGGRWGEQKELDRFLQAYAIEKAKLEARRKGYSVLGTMPSQRVDQGLNSSGRCRLKTIEITVSPTGQTSVETKGFHGGECRQASQFIEAALGQRTDERFTNDFYAEIGQQQRLQEGA